MPLLQSDHGLGIQEVRSTCDRVSNSRPFSIRPELRTMLQSCPCRARQQNLCRSRCNRIPFKQTWQLDTRIYRARIRTPGSLRLHMGCRPSKLLVDSYRNKTDRAITVNNCLCSKSLEIAKAPQKLIYGAFG